MGRWDRFRANRGTSALLICLFFVTGATLMDCWPQEPLTYRVGQYVPADIFARVTFEVASPQQTRERQELEAKNTPAVIRLDEALLQQLLSDLRNLPSKLKVATQPANLGEELKQQFLLDTPADLASFLAYADATRSEEYNRQIDSLRNNLLQRYIVNVRDFVQACVQKQTQDVHVVNGTQESLQPKSKVISLEFKGLDEFLQAAVAPIDMSIRANVYHYLASTISDQGQPLYRVDAKATAAAEVAAKESVAPVREAVQARALLVRRTVGAEWAMQAGAPSQGLTPLDLELLAAEHKAYVAQMQKDQPLRKYWVLAGRMGEILALTLFLALYIAKHHARPDKSYARGLGISIVLLAALGTSKLLVGVGGLNPSLAVFGVIMASVAMTIAYDQRFAFAVAGGLVVLTVLQLRAGVDSLLVLWTAAGATIFQLREIRTRSKLIETGAVTAAVTIAVIWATQSAQGEPANFILINVAWAAAAGITAGFIAQGILPLIERVFRVATSMTLLEWCDANRPLLKRLALEAPGTYNHCLLLGTMCEAAADAIGARGLLARVGAYYHDIGKINKPFYFIENQLGMRSPHERLSPAMSLLIIKGHVKDGLELAKEYGLPPVLREFIATHHGTTLVEYFYHAAATQRRQDIERAPDEVEFRYPGPKPRVKEAAVLMLADAAESSVRAMTEPSPGRIETQVHQVIFKRLMDGQLNECDMTLKEVYGVENSLIKSLTGMYHGRVKYPQQERADRERAEHLDQQSRMLSGKNGKNGNGKNGHDGNGKSLSEPAAADVAGGQIEPLDPAHPDHLADAAQPPSPPELAAPAIEIEAPAKDISSTKPPQVPTD